VFADKIEVVWCRGAARRRQVDRYVQAHHQACFGHAPEWREAVRRCYHLPELTLAALRGGEVVGVAPWTVMLSPLVGPYLAVAPFASYGDLLADDEEVLRRLRQETVRRARWLGMAYAQVRSLAPPPSLGTLRGRVESRRFFTSRLDLERGVEHIWAEQLHAKTRNQIRKARRLQVRVERVRAGDGAGWEGFLRVFSSGTRSLGSPFHGHRFFSTLQELWGARLDAWLARTDDGQPAAAALSIAHGEVTHYVYGQNVHALRSTCANSLVVWTMIEQACAQGRRSLDLGRSELGTPNERFKRRWGGTLLPVHETLLLGWRRRLPDLNPTNPALRAWQRLWTCLPEPLARRLGPLLIRGIA
jgi:FemAB-related protein (PEP-CTERM system-associated)